MSAPGRLLSPSFLGQATESVVEELRWLSAPPAWVLWLVIVPVAILAVRWLYIRDLPGRGGPLRIGLIALRVLLVITLVLMLCEPVARTTRFLRQDAVVLVLVDDSLSMDIADKYADRDLVGELAEFFDASEDTIESTTRYDLVRRLLRDEDKRFLDGLREKGRVVVASFAGGIRRLAEFERLESSASDGPPAATVDVLPDYASVRADQRVQQTRIADALLDAVEGVRAGRFGGEEEAISGIVLLTDGQETGGSRALGDVARRLSQRGIAVWAIGTGNPEDPKDIRLQHLDASDVVLAGDEVPFDVTISADGYAGERVELELLFDGRLVDTKPVVLEGNGARQVVRLEHRPGEPGDFTVVVRVEPRGGEIFTDNNSLAKPVRVLDQKIRILYVDGLPRWGYRYLKNALVRDPTMQAQVLLYSADRNFIQESSTDVPPLRDFPATRAELFEYHVVVIGDVAPEAGVSPRWLTDEQMEMLVEFVRDEGGGLVFVSGQDWNPLRYRETPLYSLLPVVVPEGSRLRQLGGDEPITDSFNVVLSPAGREHTVMRLENERERNVELWENPRGRPFENLPGFFGYARAGAAKKGTVVLARHPQDTVDEMGEKGAPIFAFMNYGKGRVFYSAVDDTWRWRAGVDNRYFYRFWGQVVRFVATGRLLGKTPRYQLTTDKLQYSLGETVEIEARVLDASMEPLTDPSIEVWHLAKADQARGSAPIELDLDPARGPGAYRGTVVAARLGAHELWLGTEAERLAFRSIEVLVPEVELRDPRRNDAALRALAGATGGQFLDLHRASEVLEGLEGRSLSRLGRYEDEPLWDDVWVLLLFTGLIALEWILRRAARLM